MAAPVDIRLLQLRRMLGTHTITDRRSAANAVAASPGAFVVAVFHEAADSDDVTSPATARDYLEGRLEYFGEIIPEATANVIRAEFTERLRAWE